jgi:hypothetical protein
VVSVADADAWDAWDAWAAAVGIVQPMAVRWALRWRAAALSLAMLVGFMFGAWRWGIPWAAEQVAEWVLEREQSGLGQRVLKDPEARQWLSPSELKPETRQCIDDAVASMVTWASGQVRQVRQDGEDREEAPSYRLQFCKAAPSTRRFPAKAAPSTRRFPAKAAPSTRRFPAKAAPSTRRCWA